MIAEIAELSGEGILDYRGLLDFYDCIRIEVGPNPNDKILLEGIL